MFDIQRLIIGTALLLAAFLLFSGCKTTKCIPTTEYITRDSIIVKHNTDSVRVIEKDSVFVEKGGDTVFVTKWKTLYKEHITNKVDTIYQDNTSTIVQTEVREVVPKYYKVVSWGFWALVVLIMAVIIVRLWMRFYGLRR